MARTLPEWIGRHDDAMPPSAVKRRIVDRQNNRCALTGREFTPADRIEYDHAVPLWLGGQNRESNLQAVIGEAHARKTAAEAKVRSKINKVRNRHLGIKTRKGRPMPGTKASGWKQKLDGTWVRRQQKG